MQIDNDFHSNLHLDCDFEAGVLKSQRGETQELTIDEREACNRLIVVQDQIQNNNSDEDSGDKSDDSEDDIMTVVHYTNERRYNLNRDELYGDRRFIFGSAAEVERLWSHTKHILTNSRQGMMGADNFEALLFFKINKHL